MYMFMNTKLKPKLTNSIIRRPSIQGVYTRENTNASIWGLEKGGRLLEGDVFLETYGIHNYVLLVL